MDQSPSIPRDPSAPDVPPPAVEGIPVARPSGPPWRRIITIIVAIAILSVLVATIGAREVISTLAKANPGLLFLGMLCFIPQFIVIGWRWQRLAQPFQPTSLGEAIRLVLATNTANVILPSKLGDLGKGLVLARSGNITLPGAMGLVVFEKLLDVGALALFMLGGTAWLLLVDGTATQAQQTAALGSALVGTGAISAILALYLAPIGPAPAPEAKGIVSKIRRVAHSARAALTNLRTRGASPLFLGFTTSGIWSLHLLQIGLFFACLGAEPGLARFLTLAPLAIFIGLVPLTFGGFGHRDAAFIVLFAPIPDATMLAVSLLINTRYIVPALAGWPFFARYAAKA